MHYGGHVTIAPDAVFVSTKELQPVSIHDGSCCWAIKVPIEHTEELGTHYVLSPVHPESWPVAFRVDIKLNNQPGAMASASRVLAALGANVLIAECTQSGYQHGTWSTLCESLCLKDYVLTNHKERHTGSHKDRNCLLDLANHYSAAMFIYIQQVAMRMGMVDFLIRHDNSPIDAAIERARNTTYHVSATTLRNDLRSPGPHQGFLAPGFVHRHADLAWHVGPEHVRTANSNDQVREALGKNGMQCDPNDIDELSRNVHLHNTPAVRAYPAPNLMSFWSRMRRDSLPLPFMFSSVRNALVPHELSFFRRAVRGYPMPLVADAVFDTAERYLRIMLPARNKINHRVSINIPYHIEFDAENEPSRHSTAGVLHDICNILSAKQVNIVNIANTVKHRTLPSSSNVDIEEGVVSLVGTLPQEHGTSEAKTICDSIRLEIGQISVAGAAKVEMTNIQVVPDLPIGAFVSTRFNDWLIENMTDDKNLMDVIRLQMSASGLRSIIVKSEENITDEVRAAMAGAQGLLQVLPLLEIETGPKNADLTWMHIEYGMALARGIPRVRIVDCRKPRVTLNTWVNVLKAAKEEPIIEFRSMKQLIEKAIPTAVDRLAERIRSGVSRRI